MEGNGMELALAADPNRQIEMVHQARQMLVEARSIDEIKDIRDKAEAMRLYLKQRDEGLEAQNAAAEIKLWAERRAGEVLAEMPKRDGGDAMKARSHGESELPPKISDLGIDHNESSRWQSIASLPEAEFEQHIAETKAAGKDLTTNSVLKKVKERKEEQRRQSEPEAPAEPGLSFDLPFDEEMESEEEGDIEDDGDTDERDDERAVLSETSPVGLIVPADSARPRSSVGPPAKETTVDAQCHRMIGIFYKVFEVIRQEGGITAYTSGWSAKHRKALLLQWINDRKQMDSFIQELEESLT